MKGVFLGKDALQFCLNKFDFKTVLDIGSGQGLQAEVFRQHGKQVTTLDSSAHWGRPDILADFANIEEQPGIDLFWCSHVLEHQLNVNAFLQKLRDISRPNAIIAITVPPAKHNIVGGHVTLWNAGLLLYNLVLAGFDCSEAHVKEYGYNISVVLRKKLRPKVEALLMDAGDIEKLAAFFPMPVQQGFDGNIKGINWK